ncbi:hypothetical protein MP638_001692 [Amoeboaphelidium occidentale]|nr:hypothetical protein MP638_001692 [Amoeboaphelidium occidentale]
MPGIYARQGTTGIIVYVEMNERTKPEELKELLKEAFREQTGTVDIGSVSFENSTQSEELGNEFIERYSSSQNPLRVDLDAVIPSNEVNQSFFRVSEIDADLLRDLSLSNILIYEETLAKISSWIGVQCILDRNSGEQKWPVLFGSRSMGNDFLFWDKDGKELHLNKDTVERDYRRRRDIFFVWDSIEMPTAFGPCVMCSSPRDNIGNQFKKTAHVMYMPTWSWDEIVAVYNLIYSKKDEIPRLNVVAARFFVLGGVPRLLFDKVRTFACKLIRDAVNQTDQDKLKQVASNEGPKSADDVSHRLVHRIIDATVDVNDFTECRIGFPSSYVSFEIMKEYSEQRRENSLNFLEDSSTIGILGSLRGNMFEPFAHLFIQNGFDAKARLLNADGTSQEVSVSFGRRQKAVVSGNHAKLAENPEVRTNEEKYFQPLSKTFECIDSWIVKDGETWAFQMNAGRTHRISSALCWYYKNLNVKHYVTVVYDKQKYDNYKCTQITQSKKRPFNKEEITGESCNIKQYVLLANISPETLTTTDPWVGYEAFVPEPHDQAVKQELGIL